MIKSIREVRGVGDRVYKLLLEGFGSEKAVLEALDREDYFELLRVLPFQKVVEIARQVHAAKHSFHYYEPFKTPEAREIYNSIISVIREHACTDYARLKIALFYPTRDRREIKRRLEEVTKGVELYNNLKGSDLQALKRILKKIKPLSFPEKRVSGAAVVTDDEKLYQQLKRFSKAVDVFLLKPGEDLEFLRSYDLIRVVSSGGLDHYFSGGFSRKVVACSSKVEDFLPEWVLSFFNENIDTIDSCAEALKIIGDGKADELMEISEKIKKLKKEKDKVLGAYDNLALVVDECLQEANERIVKRVEEMGISFTGREILEVLSSMEAGEGYASLPTELREVIAEAAREGEEECARRLGWDEDTAIFSGLYSSEILYPLEVNNDAFLNLQAFLAEEGARIVFEKEHEAAADIKGKEGVVRDAYRRLMEADYLLALGEFAVNYGASKANLVSSLDLSFKEGKHVLLRKLELQGKREVQPVSYSLGVSSPGSAKVTILTGANSGGKTTLIELLAQIQIMALCGLPVLARDAMVSEVEEIYFYGRRRGSSSAGAFEALLRSMAGVLKSRASKLILADEIEAVTEPGAAAKILSALLEMFIGMGNCLAVVVTHLGEEIKAVDGVRIDGIEARGLDENLNLIVDRNPVVNSLARSTPELILERLSKTDKKHKEFYKAVLKKFK